MYQLRGVYTCYQVVVLFTFFLKTIVFHFFFIAVSHIAKGSGMIYLGCVIPLHRGVDLYPLYFQQGLNITHHQCCHSNEWLHLLTFRMVNPKCQLCWIFEVFICLILYVFLPGDTLTSVTVLATQETLCLLDEDHQWNKSCSRLTANEMAEITSGQATVREMQPISCVSSILLYSSNPCKVDIQLYDEVCVYILKTYVLKLLHNI